MRIAALREQAETLERHFDLSAAEGAQLVRFRGQVVCDALERIQEVADASLDLPATARDEVRVAADTLKAAIEHEASRATGKRAAQVVQIAEACAEFDAEIASAFARAHRRLDPGMLRALRRYERARGAFEMEVKVAAACEQALTGLRGLAREERGRQMVARIAALKDQLDERRARLAEQREQSATLWRELDERLRDSVDEIGAIFESLLSPGSAVARAGKTEQ